MDVRAHYLSCCVLEWLSGLAWMVEHEARNEVGEFTEALMVAWQVPARHVYAGSGARDVLQRRPYV